MSQPVDSTLFLPRPAVEVVGVSKRFPLLARRRDRFKLLLGRQQGLAFTTALEDVSVSIQAGEAVGVIGENGSGKSTLLRLVAGISQPDVGSIVTEQPVSAILELGLGFHPDFTGRENALLYGTLLGVPETAMRERLPEVLAFAELGDFIEQPIRTYSSGMVARLAFAVATSVEPRVLVVDEALAVGDGAFQKKCVDRMVGFRDQGRTVLFCSHAMYLVTSFCQRAVWLHQGRVQMQGEVQEVVKAYGAHLKRREGEYESAHPRADHAGPAAPRSLARLERPRVTTLDGRPDTPLHPGDGFRVQVRFQTASAESAFHVAVVVDTMDGQCVFAAATQRDGRPPVRGRREHELWLRVPALPLAAGTFIVKAFLFDENGLHHYDQAVTMDGLRVEGGSWTPALLALPHEWVVSE